VRFAASGSRMLRFVCLRSFIRSSRCLTIARLVDVLGDTLLTGEGTARFIALIERIWAIIGLRFV